MEVNMQDALGKVPFRVTDPEMIPAERYYDPEFFELEKRHLWPHVWQMACRLEEIPEVGDYVEYTILDKSVIVVRGHDGVKAYHNACRHRGVRLANGPGNCAKEGFICPFHGWRWNADGECTFVFGKEIFSPEKLEQAEIDLAPVRVEFWGGCAFINFDDNASPLLDSLGPVVTRLNARNVDKLKMDWWFGTVLPTNWKLANEGFQEGYHVMQTHPQLHERAYRAADSYGPNFDGTRYNEGLSAREAVDLQIVNFKRLSSGMGGMIHETELAVLDRIADMELPDDPLLALQAFGAAACTAITEDARARGADMFDILKVQSEVEFNAVEYMFPHYFLLPTFGAMSSYRIRPLTPETCFFELWSLVIRPEDEPYDTPIEPTVIPYDSPDFPEIPRQDYSNLPIQQLGLHDIDFMRLGKGEKKGPGRQFSGGEGMISNCHRLVDGFLAGLDRETLRKGENVTNSGFNETILDIGF